MYLWPCQLKPLQLKPFTWKKSLTLFYTASNHTDLSVFCTEITLKIQKTEIDLILQERMLERAHGALFINQFYTPWPSPTLALPLRSPVALEPQLLASLRHPGRTFQYGLESSKGSQYAHCIVSCARKILV